MNQKKKSGYSVFLTIDGNDGESTSVGHEDKISLIDYSYEIARASKANPSGTGGLAEGSATHAPLVCYKYLDKSSAGIVQRCFDGENIKEVTLEVTRSTGDMATYLSIKLTNAIIASYRVLTDAEAFALTSELERPVERLEVAYTGIEFEYTQQSADGSAAGKLSATWDRAKNKPI